VYEVHVLDLIIVDRLTKVLLTFINMKWLDKRKIFVQHEQVMRAIKTIQEKEIKERERKEN